MKLQDSDDNNQYPPVPNTSRYPIKTSNSCYPFNSQTGFNKRSSSQWNKNKNSTRVSFGMNNEKNEQCSGYPAIYTSNCSHNTANLYLNKKNFTYAMKQKPKQRSNEYYEKEQLFDRVMKLQSALNTLNQKYSKQLIENDKCVKEISRQNKILNSLNYQNFKKDEINNNFNQTNEISEEKNNQASRRSSENNIISKINKNKYTLPDDDDENYNYKVKELFEGLLKECEIRDRLIRKINDENENLKKINEDWKIANGTLVSNLKSNCKNLEKENEEKSNEIAELKKNSKCSRYNELLKEKNIYEEEMNKIKKKLNEALNKVEFYKSQESEIKKLYDIIKKRDFKIKALELQLTTLSNNSDETTQKLQNELNIKDKLIKKQEREMRKDEYKRYAYEEEQHRLLESLENKNVKKSNNSENVSEKDISEKYPELYHIYIEMKNQRIESSKYYLSVLNKMNEITSLTDNKIIYSDSLINLFKIDETEGKRYILNLADKEFINNKNLPEIKNRHKKIFDALFMQNKRIKNEGDIKKLLKDKEDDLKKIFKTYDKKKLGYIKFSEMIEVINKMKLGEIKEELLLFSKSEIFNRMNYYKLLVLSRSADNKGNLEGINNINGPKEENSQVNNKNNNNNKENLEGINNINSPKEENNQVNNNNNEENLESINNINTPKEEDSHINDKDNNNNKENLESN